MTLRERWARQPQKVWMRRALFQVHLWTGVGVGLYMVLMSVTGSAIVFRVEISRFAMTATVPVVGERLNEEALRQGALAAYPGFEIDRYSEPRRQDAPVEIQLLRGEERKDLIFDPYTGTDLGDRIPRAQRLIDWLVDLHDNLLAGRTGRFVNGIGAFFLMLLCLTGAVIWWPGTGNWRRSLFFSRGSTWKRFNWELHSFCGFWSFALLFLWAITGIYFTFPDAFENTIDYFDPDPTDLERPGERFLARMVRWHFGRFGGLPVRVLWVILGLLPSILLATGSIMWWNRVLRPRWRLAGRDAVDRTLPAA